MGISPLEQQALLALRKGEQQDVERALSAYTLEDLGMLLRAVDSAARSFEASVSPSITAEAVPIEDVAHVLDLSLDDNLGSWPATSQHTEGQRVAILHDLNQFAQVIEKACIEAACEDKGWVDG